MNAIHSWRRLLAVREQSRLLTAIIGLFLAGYLVLAFLLFYHGMLFLAKFPGLGAVLTERLLYTLFAFLFALLLLSNLVIAYTNLFRNRETAFLLSLPVSPQTIFRWKFIESVVLASWAFLFLIAPLLVAFGLVRGVPWHFYPLTVFLIGLFVVLPGVFGSVQSRAGSGFKLFARPAKKSRAPGGLEKFFAGVPLLAPDTRALAVKDIRMFWRDTTQWGQSVMFFGLLGAYIINLRNFTHQLNTPFWINAVAFLNLGACAFNLASVTTRFVFPQFSLEGRRLWIVGMSPMGLERVVKTKYWLASVASLTITLGLVTLSCYLLKMAWSDVAFFGAVVTVMTFALNGLAVGLGVLYPNVKETNPNKIVSGFGGTLCFVLSSIYILASLALLVAGGGGLHAQTGLVAVCLTLFVGLSLVVGWLPMSWGLRRLKNFEA